MSSDFEWVDFGMQAPNAMAESLDAAGIDGSVPWHARDHAEDAMIQAGTGGF